MHSPIHPFPARMAPELALSNLLRLQPKSIVLDPMAGSGTVLRQAADLGFAAWGFDLDPLAVLMAKVWITPVDDSLIETMALEVLRSSRKLAGHKIKLPWIDDDPEAINFIVYWFGEDQRKSLRKLSFILHNLYNSALSSEERAALNVLRLNLSRIIVTKETGASLARDTSHSRPHKVAEVSSYDVFSGFEKSLQILRQRLLKISPSGDARVERGDARDLSQISNESVDAVLTSPPYLNAIDYLRGHRLALIWLGFKLSELRRIRSESIGAERAAIECHESTIRPIIDAMGEIHMLPSRYARMIQRYAGDLQKMVTEAARVMKRGGTATFVIGNSCLKEVFIYNSEGLRIAAEAAGLSYESAVVRELPNRNRYLPLSEGALAKRMRTETILTFKKA